MSTTLDIDVRAMLELRRGDWPAIARASQVSYSWITKFANGHIPNPGYMTLVKLHEHLVALTAGGVNGVPPTPAIAEPCALSAGEGANV